MKWTTATVVSQDALGGSNYRLTLREPEIAAAAQPGQFVELATGGATLLNKPISIAAANRDAGTFSVVYKVIGPGTRAFSSYTRERRIKILAPCGNGFDRVRGHAIVVGGGIGIPPLRFLVAENLSHATFSAILGARSRSELVLDADFTEMTGGEPMIATDDGTRGHRGMVTDLLATALKRQTAPVYACGPVPMLARVAQMCQAAAVPCYVCLEAYMGCGMGVCMGCVVPTVRGMERVCHEGPVFNAADVRWDELIKE